jgi:hypothetical protein
MSHSIFADESGTDADHKCYTIGAIVIPTSKIKGFNLEFEKLKQRHGVQNEIKWKKIGKSHGTINFAIDLLQLIIHNKFRIGFIVVKKDVYIKWQSDKENAFYTSYTMLFKHALRLAVDDHNVYIDLRQDSYDKNDEVIEKVANNMLAQMSSSATIKNVFKTDSKTSYAIQAIDLFTGAINSSHNLYLNGNISVNKGKLLLIKKIAECFGWDNLHYDTFPSDDINIWHFPREYRAVPQTVTVNFSRKGEYIKPEDIGL